MVTHQPAPSGLNFIPALGQNPTFSSPLSLSPRTRFLHEWGGDALSSSARYRVTARGNPQKFFWLFWVDSHNSAGVSVDPQFAFSQLAKRLSGKSPVEV